MRLAQAWGRRTAFGTASPTGRRLRLVHVTTVPETLLFLRGQVAYMRERGFEVTLVSSPGRLLDRCGSAEGARTVACPMERGISPLRDVVALSRLSRVLRQLRPQIVHAHTPKAGLLAMTAAWLLRVPVRIYHIHGLVYVTATGFRRHLLKRMEWLSCVLATRVLCVSDSALAEAQTEGTCPTGKGKVLLHGSINGVDAVGRYDPARFAATRDDLRRDLGLTPHSSVIGFVGRVVSDKGIPELWTAWLELREQLQDSALLIVGSVEDKDAVPPHILNALRSDSRARMIDFQDDVAPYYAVMDVLVLPSRREGFGMTALEASAMGLPVVASRIPGLVDAVEDGVTGTLVPPESSKELRSAVSAYLSDPRLRERHGSAGRERALTLFRPESMWAEVFDLYRCAAECDVSRATGPSR